MPNYWTDFTCCKWWKYLADIKSYKGINLCSLLLDKRGFGLSKLNRSNFANDTFSKSTIKSTLLDHYAIAVNLNTSIGNKETKVRFMYYRVFKKTNVDIFKCFVRQERWSEVSLYFTHVWGTLCRRKCIIILTAD